MKKLVILFLIVFFFPAIIIVASQNSLHLLATLEGENAGDRFFHCASAGDVNGDGYMDIIVGANQDWMKQPGYIKIYFGGAIFDTIPDLKIIGEGKDPYGHYTGFGQTVACAGDVNKDGYDDVIVGAPYAYNNDWDAGKVYIFFGGNPMDTVADVILQDSYYNYHFGSSVSSAGDVNGDGYDDVIIGAPNDFIDGRGRAIIYFGGENMDNVFDVFIEGESSDALGTSVTGIGDMNRDGYDDVLIGAPQFGGWPYSTGKASIYYGGNPMDTVPDVAFYGDSLNFHNFGRVVASAGDVNGDSAKDIIAAGNGGPRGVKLFVTEPSSPGLNLDTFYLIGEYLRPSSFGLSLSYGGDINQDGFAEVLVGDYQQDKVYIFYGGKNIDSLFDLVLAGYDSLDFATQIAFAGDINGDGYGEILVSSLGDLTLKGKIYIFTSNPTSVNDDEQDNAEKRFYLGQNYPNPFNEKTVIDYSLDESNITLVTIKIYNILGVKVKTLVEVRQVPGDHQVFWDGRDDLGQEVSSGIYFYQLKTPECSQVRKMIFLK